VKNNRRIIALTVAILLTGDKGLLLAQDPAANPDNQAKPAAESQANTSGIQAALPVENQPLPEVPPESANDPMGAAGDPMGAPGGPMGAAIDDPAIAPQDNMPPPDPALAAQETLPVESVNDSAPALSTEEAMDGVKISKERISLDLKGIDLNEFFRILALKMEMTIVPTRNVGGRINIFLNNLTFEDALDVILISQDLACDYKGNIINIMTSAEYEKLYGKRYNEKRKFASLKLSYAKPATVFNALSQIKSDIGKVIVDEATGTILMIDIPEKITLMEDTAKELDRPNQTEIFDIKYAKASEMKTHLAGVITQGPGEVFVDERSSKAVITDLPDKMKKIRRMVKAFDAETKQVYIEAEVLQITLKKEYQREMNWEKVFKQKWLEGLDLKGTFNVNPSFTPSPALTTSNFQITMGTLATDRNTETYKFLETFGDTKIISSPRLAVVNNQEAKILVGSREAYVTTSQSQAETTTVTSEAIEFIDVGTKLTLVPTINEDGFITMKIKPEVSSVRETLTTTLGSKVPIVETSEAETMVKIKDGNTIIIAGLIKQDKRKDTTGWPFLEKIPILGTFFGSRADLNKKTEVVIFITPHIIRGDTMLAGTEPQHVIPADIAPKDVKEDIIERLVDKEIEKESAGERDRVLLENNPAKSLFSVTPADKSAVSLQGKIKGLKEY